MICFNNLVLSKNIIVSFIKVFQKNGFKEFSEKIVKKIFCHIKVASKRHPFVLFMRSLENVKFYSEMKSVKISGINYKIPIEIKPKRQKSLIYKLIIINVFEKKDFNVDVNLIKEILDTSNSLSATIKLSDNLHKIAELNKIYIQYRY